MVLPKKSFLRFLKCPILEAEDPRTRFDCPEQVQVNRLALLPHSRENDRCPLIRGKFKEMLADFLELELIPNRRDGIVWSWGSGKLLGDRGRCPFVVIEEFPLAVPSEFVN